MPAINFQKRFAGQVKDRTKRQTIRGIREGKGQNPFKGCDLYLYEGMRTEGGATLIGKVTCQETKSIQLDEHEAIVNGCLLNDEAKDALARDDGFKNFEDMLDWFRKNHKLPFTGNVIIW